MSWVQRSVLEKFPVEVKKKIEALTRARGLVKKFTKKLQAAQKECDWLEKELAGYLDATAPVHACPPEVLSVIFQFYLKENPRMLRLLMLVCRRWYNIVVNDPTLWAKIRIRIDENDSDYKQLALEESLYTKACLQRSQSCLLDINIDLVFLQHTSTRVVRSMNEHIKKLLGADSHIADNVEDWIEQLDVERFDLLAINADGNPSYILDVIKTLVGNNGEHMSRWSILGLSLPAFDKQLAFQVWRLFEGETPNLTHLAVDKVGYAYDNLGSQFSCAFPNLSAIKFLIAGPAPNLDFLALSFEILEHLVVVTDIGKPGSLDLNRFQWLRVLNIICPPHVSSPWVSDTTPPATYLSLSHLKSLTFSGCFTNINSVQFDLPALTDLALDTSQYGPSDISHQLPNINAPTIWWKFHADDGSLNLVFILLLKLVLVHFKQSHTLYVHSSMSNHLISAIRALELQGQWPGNWEYIMAGDEVIWDIGDSVDSSDSDWLDTDFSDSFSNNIIIM